MFFSSRLLSLFVIVFSFSCVSAFSHELTSRVKQIKQSVVGIGTYEPLGSPRARLSGSGFVVADGSLIVTNYHVIEKPLDEERNQQRVVFAGSGSNPKTLFASVLEIDPLHDLALLKIQEKLPAMQLGAMEKIDDGTEIAFTGFPIGAVLGLYPATHRGIVSAYTPVVIPANNSQQLDILAVKRLRDPYFVYQLDATAYPGNSGSAVYEVKDGRVVAVINKVFVKRTKESALSDPSGITYAIPVKYVHQLLEKVKTNR